MNTVRRRAGLYNPLCGLWQKVGNVDTSKQKFAVYNDSLVRYHVSGHKRYEFANHLGNVLAVTSDRKIGVDTLSGTKLDFYYADLYSVSDYDPFGMVQPGRSWNRKESYRYSFNGKEDESWGVQDYGFRHYDPLIARFISVDPLKDEYPWYTPYQFAGNTPVSCIDIDGLEPGLATGVQFKEVAQYKKEEPKYDYNKVSENIETPNFTIAPNYQNVNGQEVITHYNAFIKSDNRHAYVIGTDAIESFKANESNYMKAASLFYMNGTPT